MNDCKTRRASISTVVLIVSIVAQLTTAQQFIDSGGGRLRSTPNQNFFQQRPLNPLRFQSNESQQLIAHHVVKNGNRTLFARQISRNHLQHRLRNRSSKRLMIRTTTHQPSIAQLTNRVYRPRVVSKTNNTNKNTEKPMMTTNQFFIRRPNRISNQSNISRRPRPQSFNPVFRSVQRPRMLVTNSTTSSLTPPSSPPRTRGPLSSIPFGAFQQRPQRTRILNPSPRRPRPQQSLRRPISVQPGLIALRRKPLTTPPVFHPEEIVTPQPAAKPRKLQTSRRRPAGAIRRVVHRPTHQFNDRISVSRQLPSQTSDQTLTSTELIPNGNPLKKVDDIEAAILRAVIDSSTTSPVATVRSRSHHRVRVFHTTSAPTAIESDSTTTTMTEPPRVRTIPSRIDSIEEAVLRAVLGSTEAPVTDTSTLQPVSLPTSELPTTTERIATSSLFPAFASRRPFRNGRPLFFQTPSTTIATLGTTAVTEKVTTLTTEAMRPTVGSTITSRPNTITTMTRRTTNAPTTPTMTITTTTTTPPTTTTGPTPPPTTPSKTTTVRISNISGGLPPSSRPIQFFDDHFDANSSIERKNLETNDVVKEEDDHQLHQIEQNIIAALSSSSSPEPPSTAPLTTSIPHLFAGPPGSFPPSDDIVDELNSANDFMQVAERLNLLKRLLQ